MKQGEHLFFVLFLVCIVGTAAAALTIHGWGYYILSIADRPYSPEYSSLRPSGPFGHGLGILGTLMIVTGVAMYSTRKRVRALSGTGKLSRWLEIHIVLCLLGPVLVIYHTTFKIGGVAAITFWTMTSVAASGIVGRFLYTRIPRNVQGNQLTQAELASEITALGATLSESPIGAALIRSIDESLAGIPASPLFSSLLAIERAKRRIRRDIRRLLAGSGLSHTVADRLQTAAGRRAALMEQSVVLRQVEKIFNYWHAVHLPFTVIMFITLALHVTVVLLLGYRWVG